MTKKPPQKLLCSAFWPAAPIDVNDRANAPHPVTDTAPDLNTASPLNLLAIDTSTHRLSVGVVSRASPCHACLHDGEGGAQASASLVPTVMSALAQAGLALPDLDAIVFGRGPGAFTGLRTATAVVQGLAYGTRSPRHPDGLPVLGIDTLLAVAEDARHALHTAGQLAGTPCVITALLDARMDELYAATYVFDDPARPVAQLLAGPWLTQPDALFSLLPPAAHAGWLVGNAFEAYGARLPVLPPPIDNAAGTAPDTDATQPPHGTPRRLSCWPSAAALLRLAPAMLADGQATRADGAQPVYVRDQVAKTTLERAAEQAAAAHTPVRTPA